MKNSVEEEEENPTEANNSDVTTVAEPPQPLGTNGGLFPVEILVIEFFEYRDEFTVILKYSRTCISEISPVVAVKNRKIVSVKHTFRFIRRMVMGDIWDGCVRRGRYTSNLYF